MKIELPYSELDLMLAAHSIDESKLTKEKEEELIEEIKKEFPKGVAERNKKIAEENGITVKDLIDSPNYKILCEEHEERVIKSVIQKIVKKFGITERQAWAGLALAKGVI